MTGRNYFGVAFHELKVIALKPVKVEGLGVCRQSVEDAEGFAGLFTVLSIEQAVLSLRGCRDD
jgi:hypothetical protein